MRKLTVLAALLLLIPSVSQAKSLEDLLVEKGVITKSEARGAAHESSAKVYWKGGSRLDFADVGFTTKIYTRIQTRYTFTDTDNDVNPGANNVSSFRVRRARIGIQGSALHKEFDYKAEVELAGSSARLTDAFIQWNACDWGGLKMGQFKTRVSRQNYNSSRFLQFADRSVASDYFAFDRNQGAATTVALGDNWEFGAALFNGNSDGEGYNSRGADTKHLGVLHVRGNVMGEMNPYMEGDIDGTEDAAVNVGVAVGVGENELAALGGTTDETVVSADVNFKYQGWSFNGEYFYLEHDPDAGQKNDTQGFYVQGGYFVVPGEWEVAARFARIDCDDSQQSIGNDIRGGLGGGTNYCLGADEVNAYDIGINYYWWKHHLKAQFGWSLIDTDFANGVTVNGEDDEGENRWIFQLSSYF